MSTIFYTYRNGKKESAYKYENTTRIWYTKDKSEKTEQITVYTNDDVAHNSWGLTEEDPLLTQNSYENAGKAYNEKVLKIAKKIAEILEKENKKMKNNNKNDDDKSNKKRKRI